MKLATVISSTLAAVAIASPIALDRVDVDKRGKVDVFDGPGVDGPRVDRVDVDKRSRVDVFEGPG
ncbi:hypothetical protein EMPG_17613, partial [Blastomyces silverae]